MEPDQKLLDILACPQCKGDLSLTSQKDGLICEKCRLKYPIREGIPVMLIDEAIKLDL
ncbi:Trm112 family protein [bacterium]|nr:Trm112 family protein [bacterium]